MRNDAPRVRPAPQLIACGRETPASTLSCRGFPVRAATVAAGGQLAYGLASLAVPCHPTSPPMVDAAIATAPNRSATLAAELDGLARQHRGDAAGLRAAAVKRLKSALKEALADARATLEDSADGCHCARRLSASMDDLLVASLPVHCQSPLPQRQPVDRRADGGRRHRRLRPRHAGAALRHRSVVPAALQADAVGRERHRGGALLVVGRRPQGRPRGAHCRAVGACRRRRHDHPHGAARHPLHPRQSPAGRRSVAAAGGDAGAADRARFHRRQVRRAGRAPQAQWLLALQGRTQSQGWQGRPQGSPPDALGEPDISP